MENTINIVVLVNEQLSVSTVSNWLLKILNKGMLVCNTTLYVQSADRKSRYSGKHSNVL